MGSSVESSDDIASIKTCDVISRTYSVKGRMRSWGGSVYGP